MDELSQRNNPRERDSKVREKDVLNCINVLENEFQDELTNTDISETKNLGILDEALHSEDEEILKHIFDLYEQLKQTSQTEGEDQIEEVVIEDDYTIEEMEEGDQENYNEKLKAMQTQMNGQEKVNQSVDILLERRLEMERRKQKVQDFLERSNYFSEQREKSIVAERKQQQKTLDEMSSLTCGKGGAPNPNRRQVLTDWRRQQLDKIEVQMEERRKQQLKEELQECTFKPILNHNSLALFPTEHRSPDEFYRDMLVYRQQRGLKQTSNINKQDSQTEVKKIGSQADLGRFIERVDEDIARRVLKQMIVQQTSMPSFAPVIYQKIRSPTIIKEMQANKQLYQKKKVEKEEEERSTIVKNKDEKAKKVVLEVLLPEEKKLSRVEQASQNSIPQKIITRNSTPSLIQVNQNEDQGPLTKESFTQIPSCQQIEMAKEANLTYLKKTKNLQNTNHSQKHSQGMIKTLTQSEKIYQKKQSEQIIASNSIKCKVESAPTEQHKDNLFKNFLQDSIQQLKQTLDPRIRK